MDYCSKMARCALFAAMIGAAALAAPASAATYTETTDFSSVAASPTVIASGTTGVSGTLTSGDSDYLAISVTKANTPITLSFGLTDTTGSALIEAYYSYSKFSSATLSYASGSLLNSAQTVTALTALTSLGTTASYSITPASGFVGTIYLALTNVVSVNSSAAYSFNIPTATVAAVPAPAAGFLLVSAIGLAGALRRRKSA